MTACTAIQDVPKRSIEDDNDFDDEAERLWNDGMQRSETGRAALRRVRNAGAWMTALLVLGTITHFPLLSVLGALGLILIVVALGAAGIALIVGSRS